MGAGSVALGQREVPLPFAVQGRGRSFTRDLGNPRTLNRCVCRLSFGHEANAHAAGLGQGLSRQVPRFSSCHQFEDRTLESLPTANSALMAGDGFRRSSGGVAFGYRTQLGIFALQMISCVTLDK